MSYEDNVIIKKVSLLVCTLFNSRYSLVNGSLDNGYVTDRHKAFLEKGMKPP